MTPLGIKPATFWLVAQCLNQLRATTNNGQKFNFHQPLSNLSQYQKRNISSGAKVLTIYQ